MPSSWIKGLVTWLCGLILAVLMVAAVTGNSVSSGAVGAVERSVELELPGLTGTPTLTECTV